MTKKRMVKLVHAGGATKEVSEVQVLLEKKHLGVQLPTAGLMWFNFMTGLRAGRAPTESRFVEAAEEVARQEAGRL
jgi:hypothetical protein